MTNKLILVGLGIVAIGLLALPQTFALFVGQHNWYDTTTADNGIPCQKCHADVWQEIYSTQGGAGDGVNSAHRAQTSDGGCQACHMTVAPANEGLTQGPNGQYHAAIAPACIDCHGGRGPGLSALEIQSGSDEVHKDFVNQANDTADPTGSKFLKGANEACIACHTHVAVDITWTKKTNITLTAHETINPDGSHGWIVGNYNAVGDVTFTTHGNETGAGTVGP